jgi:DNA-binding NarL/FixJ family response regulator
MAPLRLLVVEDQPIVRDAIRLVVESIAGARVVAETAARRSTWPRSTSRISRS